MAKKVDKTTTDLRKLIDAGRVVIGTKQTLKGLLLGRVEQVYVAKNCAELTKASLHYYQKLSSFEITELGVLSDELGAMCKKQFAISVLGILK